MYLYRGAPTVFFPTPRVPVVQEPIRAGRIGAVPERETSLAVLKQ